MEIIKRDGRKMPFNQNKIIDAVLAAFKEVDGEITDYAYEKAGNIADYVQDYCKQLEHELTVEEIQDMVEKGLSSTKRKDVAKVYILYREKRRIEREKQSKIVRAVLRRNTASDVENSNANVDERSFSGREKEASSDIQKIIALDYTLSKEISDAHKSMLLYQHDLEKTNIGQHNCLNIDFKKLFTEGFTTRNGDIRPPSTFATACQLMAVIFQCQSQVQFGGVGSVHADLDLAPFVRKSFIKHFKNYFSDVQDYTQEQIIKLEKKYKEISLDNEKIQKEEPEAYNFAVKQLEREGRQSAEALFHNLNTLESRAGSQVPFTSLNYGRDLSTEGKLV